MKITVATEFTDTPAGRFKEDGPYSGEVFRESLLVPALKESPLIEIDLDGTEGYGSSFLEEAFGGLVRSEKFRANELHKKIRFYTEDKLLEMEIWSYIDEAK